MNTLSLRIFTILAVVTLGALAYTNTFTGGWVWDDASSVQMNEHIQDPSYFFQLFGEDQHPFGQGQGNFYRPLVATSFMVDYQLSNAGPEGARPGVFHLGNLFWHVLAAILLMALLTRLKAPPFVAVATPLVYALHPMHTEAVAYISGRADMMSAVFMFAGLCFALKRPLRVAGVVLSAVCFCLALLSKESSLIFPVLLGVLLILRPSEEGAASFWKPRAVPLAVSAVLVVLYGGLRATWLNFADPEAPATVAAPLGERLMQTGQAFTFYLHKLIWPTDLHMEQTLAGVPGWQAALGWALILGTVMLFVVALNKGQRRIAMGLAWFIGAWIPISGIFPLNAPMAEHWMYVPMAGLWWAVMEGLALLPRRAPLPALRTGLVYALCLLFLVLTVQRNPDWRDNETIFRATLEDNPFSERVRANLAITYQDILKNDPGAVREYTALLALYQAGKRTRTGSLRPNEVDALLSLGRVLVRRGDHGLAIPQFQMIVDRAPQSKFSAELTYAAFELGRCCLAVGDMAGAARNFSKAVQLNPEYAPLAQRAMEGRLPLGRG